MEEGRLRYNSFRKVLFEKMDCDIQENKYCANDKEYKKNFVKLRINLQ